MLSSSIAFALFTIGSPNGSNHVGFVNYIAGIALCAGSVFGAKYGVKLVTKSTDRRL